MLPTGHFDVSGILETRKLLCRCKWRGHFRCENIKTWKFPHAHESRSRLLSGHDHVPCQSAGSKSSRVTPILAWLHLPVKRLERSAAIGIPRALRCFAKTRPKIVLGKNPPNRVEFRSLITLYSEIKRFAWN